MRLMSADCCRLSQQTTSTVVVQERASACGMQLQAAQRGWSM
jgi:hypothetical protein